MYKFFIKISFILFFFSCCNSAVLGMGISYFKKNTLLYKKYYKKHLDNTLCLLNFPDDIFFTIFAELDNKNAFQLISKKAQVRGSKRVPNFYSIAKCPGFIANEKDYTYGMINATYDKRIDVIKNIETKTSNKKHEHHLYVFEAKQMFIGINSANKVYYRLYQKTSSEALLPTSTTIVGPNPLMMACYSGNLKKVESLLKDNEENEAFRKMKVLEDAFAIAVGKNDIDCLKLFILERNKEDCLVRIEFLMAQHLLLADALDLEKKEAFEAVFSSHWQVADFYKFPAIMFANTHVLVALEKHGRCRKDNVVIYSDTINYLLNVYNVERKRKGWETSIKLLLKQDKDLNVKIKQPLIEALQKNDIKLLQKLVGKMENKQLFYDNKCRNCLREIHLDVLKEAIKLKNHEGFAVLSRLRLEGKTRFFGEYHAELLKIIHEYAREDNLGDNYIFKFT